MIVFFRTMLGKIFIWQKFESPILNSSSFNNNFMLEKVESILVVLILSFASFFFLIIFTFGSVLKFLFNYVIRIAFGYTVSL